MRVEAIKDVQTCLWGALFEWRMFMFMKIAVLQGNCLRTAFGAAAGLGSRLRCCMLLLMMCLYSASGVS